MKLTFISSLSTLILGIVISSMIYAESGFRIGNKADIIETEVRIYFFFILFLIVNISYIIMHYLFKLNDKYVFILTNTIIFVFVVTTTKSWKEPQIVIYYPVFVFLTIVLFLLKNFKNYFLKKDSK